ncbi:uroplakin-3b [Astyanax mexicanus]|uniref:uroplakin-3b n=1 Tax=Astyanax mexicanus TaxID=7994 RepID=UPI0020CB313D|nr:uroplakin-3b [Astyanax mexicanus]
MEVYLVLCFICMLPIPAKSITTVDCKPAINESLAAKITINTVILQQPRCCFDNLTNLPCTSNTCEIWLVPAVDTGLSTFDANKASSAILSLSPYPTAFTGSSPANYFLTKVGLQSDFPCVSPSPGGYFRVGADGACSTTNCNGFLPQGSSPSFKYLLVDSVNKTVLAETKWSDSIALYTLKDPGTLGDGFAGRSGAMVIITTLLSVAAAVLLLFLIVVLALCCCGGKSKGSGSVVGSVMGSFRIPRYDTHHLKDPAPYDNPAYEKERKYTTQDTLPKTKATSAVNPVTQDTIKLQKI